MGGNIVTMQLDRHPCGMQKARHHVAFSEELDLGPWMHPSSPELAEGASLMYDLTAVIVHRGRSAEGGHYVAACRLGESSAEVLAKSLAEGAAKAGVEAAAKGVAERAAKGDCRFLLPLCLLLVVCYSLCFCQHAWCSQQSPKMPW